VGTAGLGMSAPEVKTHKGENEILLRKVPGGECLQQRHLAKGGWAEKRICRMKKMAWKKPSITSIKKGCKSWNYAQTFCCIISRVRFSGSKRGGGKQDHGKSYYGHTPGEALTSGKEDAEFRGDSW